MTGWSRSDRSTTRRGYPPGRDGVRHLCRPVCAGLSAAVGVGFVPLRALEVDDGGAVDAGAFGLGEGVGIDVDAG